METVKEALANGLVDEIGSLNDAIAYAAKDNGLKEYRTVSYPTFEMDFKTMFRRFGANLRGENLRNEMGVEAYEVYQQVKHIRSATWSASPFRIRCETEIVIKINTILTPKNLLSSF